jgi:hypothetical protein
VGATNIHFRYIRLERYRNGITLRAGETGLSNSHNSVYGSYFYQVGGYWTTWTLCEYPSIFGTWKFLCKPGGVGALNISNSDHNAVENNHFVSIRNDSVHDGHIHAIYISHGSDHNHVARNRFYSVTGEAFRIRNWSWYNLIEANVFSKVGDADDAGYGDWYDIDGNDDTGDFDELNRMANGDDERSSCANEFLNNILDGRFDCAAPLRVFTYHDLPDRCPAGIRRLRTSGNVKTSTPCTY